MKVHFWPISAIRSALVLSSPLGRGCVKTQISDLRMANCDHIARDIDGKVCFSGITNVEESHLEEILHQRKIENSFHTGSAELRTKLP